MGVIALVAGRLSDLSALPTPQLVTVPFLLGISSHLAYFKHGEHDLKVFTYLLTFIVTSSTLCACLGARTAAIIESAYFAALFEVGQMRRYSEQEGNCDELWRGKSAQIGETPLNERNDAHIENLLVRRLVRSSGCDDAG